ncbi:MAG: hypothetical protein KAI40_01915 [Desulfobacterales bacterium]|nr:hypothetical protein [Desulfobacterales bacterium]
MNKSKLKYNNIMIMGISVFLFLLFFNPTIGFADNIPCPEKGYVTKLENGAISWGTGCITAKGKASPSKEDKGKSSSSIPGAAKTDATKNLISILKNIKIATNSVKEFVASNDDIMAQIENTISDVSVIKQHYTSDGALEIEVETSMYGSFLQFILPHEIIQIPEIKSIETNSDVQKQRGRYTGFVLDARGLKFEPSLYPVIKNEYGEEIYSAVFINREYAAQYGVCKYFCSMEKAVVNKRVGENPLVLKALRLGEDKNSIILNKSDAEKIEKLIERHSFFKECRVVIVLDQE